MIELKFPQTEEENQMVGAWVAQRIPNFQPQQFVSMAFVKDKKTVVAAAVFHNYRVTDCEVVFAADPGTRWAQRDLINMVLRYPFKIGCNRITALARKDNKKVRKLLQQLGFKQEGKLRAADIDRHDIFVYGLLPGENRMEREPELRKAA